MTTQITVLQVSRCTWLCLPSEGVSETFVSRCSSVDWAASWRTAVIVRRRSEAGERKEIIAHSTQHLPRDSHNHVFKFLLFGSVIENLLSADNKLFFNLKYSLFHPLRLHTHPTPPADRYASAWCQIFIKFKVPLYKDLSNLMVTFLVLAGSRVNTFCCCCCCCEQ